MKIKTKDVIVLGFALFAMFFGAGNVIFPPYLGLQSSPHWLPAIVAFIFADVVLACFAIIVMAKNDHGIACITSRIGKIPSIVLNVLIILCMGPLIGIPRTAAASYDLMMVPIFDCQTGTWVQWVYSLVFYIITWCLVIRPNKICDIVGKILTPLLLITIIMFFWQGIVNPIGPQATYSLTESPVGDGLIAGYQSMDLFGALCFGSLMINTAKSKGYSTKESRVKLIGLASLICFVLLCTTSICMTYLGSTTTFAFSSISSQAVLLTKIGMYLFSFGGPLIGLLATLACITTSIGASSGTALYFRRFIKKPEPPKKPIAYEIIATITCCVSFVISNIGFESIVNFASPVLLTVFPMIVVLVILSWFNDKIKSHLPYKLGAYTALIVNLFILIGQYFQWDLFNYIPLSNQNLGWVIPCLLAIGIAFLITKINKK